MEDDIVEAFQEILKVAQDEEFTSDEALDVIMAIAENVLHQYGHPTEAESDDV